MNKPSQLAIKTAAQVWAQPETSSIVMDTKLAMAFAAKLDEVWSKPWLGNATTRELIAELSARCEVGSINGDYKTVQDA
jgi:hypothetical protein